jgi:hypothetical protein
MPNFASDHAPVSFNTQGAVLTGMKAGSVARNVMSMKEKTELLTTAHKARRINFDAPIYGTFAEIGAGQEVAREFFHAGGASGTIAKSISAYDMVFSDAIYGKSPRYVSRERLNLMLDHEYGLLVERLSEIRGDRTNFFVFADTVATSNPQGTNEAHGWLGIRFQAAPSSEPSEIVLHVRMRDKDTVLQQQALGIVGVNLIYGALYLRSDPRELIESLQDNLGTDKIEVDMLRFRGTPSRQSTTASCRFTLWNASSLTQSCSGRRAKSSSRQKSYTRRRFSLKGVVFGRLHMSMST